MAGQTFRSYYDYLLTVDSVTKTAPSWEFSYTRSVLHCPVQSFIAQFHNFSAPGRGGQLSATLSHACCTTAFAKNVKVNLLFFWISTLENIEAAWRSGNIVGRINEVTLRRARLVLRWVTCPGSTPGGGTLFLYVTSHPGRLSLSSFRGR